MTPTDIFLSINYHPTDGGRTLTKRVGTHTFVLRAPAGNRTQWLWENLCVGLKENPVAWEQKLIGDARPVDDVLNREAWTAINVGTGDVIVPHEPRSVTVKGLLDSLKEAIDRDDKAAAFLILDRVQSLVILP